MSKKLKIMKEAANLFAEKGFNSTSTSEIAEAAETAHGTVFYHFPTKMDIIKSIYDTLSNDYWEAQNASYIESETGLENVLSMLRTTFDFAEEHSAENTVLHRDLPAHIFTDKEWTASIQEHNSKVIKRLEQYIEKGIADGSVKDDVDPKSFSTLLRAMVIGVIKIKYAKAYEVNIDNKNIEAFCKNALTGRS